MALTEHGAQIASKATATIGYGGSGSAILFGLSAHEFAAIAGLIVGVIGMAANIWLNYHFRRKGFHEQVTFYQEERRRRDIPVEVDRRKQSGAINRTLVTALSLSAAAFVGLLAHEGYVGEAYPDPTHGWSVPTIGFGTTHGVRQGDRTDPVSAVQRAMRDVEQFEGAIRQCVHVPLSQIEYDVYVDMAYNIGAAGFCRSTMVRRLNAGNYTGACDAILMWRFSAGQDCSDPANRSCRGLWQRRLAAHQRCMSVQH